MDSETDLNKVMRIAYRLIILCGVGLFLSQLPLTIAPNLFQPMLFGVFFLGVVFVLIATLIMGLVSWRKSSRWWMGPALLCMAFILSFIIWGRIETWAGFDHLLFKRNMAPYVNIVDSIKSGAISCGPTIANIHSITNLPPGIRNIDAVRCTDGSVLVLFVAKGSSFAGHMGYLFKDTETNNYIADYIKREQIRLSLMTGNWYEFWD